MSDSIIQPVLLYVQTAPSSAACPQSMQHTCSFPATEVQARACSLNMDPHEELKHIASVESVNLATTEVCISIANLVGKSLKSS